MLKKTFIVIILALIILTTFIKNHTKKLDEKIFSIKENINYLINIKELAQLEYNYLSSPSRLQDYNILYFDNEFQHTSWNNIEIIETINQIEYKTLNQNGQ